MIESAIRNSSPIFSFDKTRIISKKSKSQLRSRLPLRKLSELSQRTHLTFKEGKGGYRSKIEVERPQQEWFTILNKYNVSEDNNRLGKYKVSYLELAYDWEMLTDVMAVKVSKYIANRFRKSYRRSCDPIKTREDYDKDEGRPYFYAAVDQDNKDCVVVIYSRRSKINGLPIVRIEWRLKSAATIKNYNHFMEMEFFNKYFLLEEINYEALGKWLAPNNYKAKKSRNFIYKPRPGYIFCRALNISSSTDLRSYIKRRKDALSKKPGRHTKFQKKIEQLTPYIINKYFNKIKG